MVRKPDHEDDRRFHPRAATRRYVVRVGHFSVTVDCGSSQQAVREARRRLEVEMPRLWDVIAQLEPSRFRVQEVRD